MARTRKNTEKKTEEPAADLVIQKEDGSVEMMIEAKKQRRDTEQIMVRGSSEWKDAVARMADHFGMPIAVLFDVALRHYSRAQNYPHELPGRATSMKEVD